MYKLRLRILPLPVRLPNVRAFYLKIIWVIARTTLHTACGGRRQESIISIDSSDTKNIIIHPSIQKSTYESPQVNNKANLTRY